MTIEEAKRRLLNIERSLPNTFRTKEEVRNFEALEMAIKALEQEPTPNDDYFRKMAGVVISQLRTDRDRLEDELAKREQEPSVEFVKTEESNDNGTKYLNINVSDDEVKRNPDIVRICSDVGMLEYMKPKTGHWIKSNIPNEEYVCSECGGACWYYDYQASVAKSKFCPNCGAKMVEPQESEDKE